MKSITAQFIVKKVMPIVEREHNGTVYRSREVLVNDTPEALGQWAMMDADKLPCFPLVFKQKTLTLPSDLMLSEGDRVLATFAIDGRYYCTTPDVKEGAFLSLPCWEIYRCDKDGNKIVGSPASPAPAATAQPSTAAVAQPAQSTPSAQEPAPTTTGGDDLPF